MVVSRSVRKPVGYRDRHSRHLAWIEKPRVKIPPAKPDAASPITPGPKLCLRGAATKNPAALHLNHRLHTLSFSLVTASAGSTASSIPSASRPRRLRPGLLPSLTVLIRDHGSIGFDSAGSLRNGLQCRGQERPGLCQSPAFTSRSSRGELGSQSGVEGVGVSLEALLPGGTLALMRELFPNSDSP